MIENLTCSDFFIGRVNVDFMYVDEEGSSAARGKRSLTRKSTAM
ncbi:hypothetical protein [Priestia megaterium]|nr:hypothetical protein [Priestia megaterium]MDH3171702.1 hypothetical protein [Priestia megaterium]